MAVTHPITGNRFLVVRLGAIGDVLRVLPAVRRLRRDRPNAKIGWVVEHWAYPAIAGNLNVDRFHVLDRRALKGGVSLAVPALRRLIAEIREQRYDAVLDFHGRLKSGLITRLSGVDTRIGYAAGDSTEWNHLFTNVHVKLEDRWENRVLRFLHLLSPLGVDTSYDPGDLGLYLGPDLRRMAERWYRAAGSPALAAYPGTSKARAAERWPAEKWVELLTELGTENVRSVLFWGPAEEELARDIAAASGSQCSLAPPTTLPEMMAMVGCFRAYVGSDTGAHHMAWMQGVPSAVFVGLKPPRTVPALPPVPSRVLHAAGLYREDVKPSRQPPEVVGAVPVAEVLDAVRTLLAAPRRREREQTSEEPGRR